MFRDYNDPCVDKMFEVDAFITTDGKNKGTSMARYIGRAVRDMRQYGDRDRKQPTVIGFASLSDVTQMRVNDADEVFDEQVLGANEVSIITDELHAISLAMALIHCSNEKNFIIFSDSMSSLKALSGFKVDLDVVYSILKDFTRLAGNGKAIVFCWIPSHITIRGNETADAAAKSALTLPIKNI